MWASLGVGVIGGAMLITTLFEGFYCRRGLWTLELDDGAATIWKAVPTNAAYAHTDSTKVFPVTNHNLASHTPMLTTSAGRFDWMARVPLWIPVVLAGAAAGVLRWTDSTERRRRAGLCIKCGDDRRGIDNRSPCPECGRAVAPW
jgi:hypothetical protein